MKKIFVFTVIFILAALSLFSSESIPSFSREAPENRSDVVPIMFNMVDLYPTPVYFTNMTRAFRSKEDYISEITRIYVDFGTRDGLTNHLTPGIRWLDTKVEEEYHADEKSYRLAVTVFLDIPQEIQEARSLQRYDLSRAEMNLFSSFEVHVPEVYKIGFYYYDKQQDEYRDLQLLTPEGIYVPDEKKWGRDLAPRVQHASSYGQGRPQGSLTGKSVVINAGHGFHDHLTYNWILQRGLTFMNYEDFHNAEFLNQFAVPYFYNAGASVWSVREMDLNENMIIVDVEDGEDYPANGLYLETGSWSNSTGAGFESMQVSGRTSYAEGENPFASGLTRFAYNNANGTSVARWIPNIPEDGYYNVYLSWHGSGNRTDAALYRVHHTGGSTDFYINQQINGQTWYFIGSFFFEEGLDEQKGSVHLINENSDGNIISADAVRFGGGLGLIRRTESSNQTSGYPKWEEDAVYNIQFMGAPTSEYYWSVDGNNPDERRGWHARPRFARWRQAQEELDTVYIAWHTNAFNGTARGYRTYVHETQHRQMDVDYRNAVHDRMIQEILEGPYGDQFHTTHVKRFTNFGENWPGNLGDHVPGFLIEAIFHDNEQDMLLYRNPYFRHFMARAFYHGVVDYFNQRDHGGSHVLKYLPEPPQNLRVYNLGGHQVHVEWDEPISRNPNGTPEERTVGDAAENYKVYLSRNGFGFDNGREVSGTHHVFNDLEPGELYFVRVTALNSGGESFATETLSFTVANTAGRILIVNGFNRFDRGLLARKYYPATREHLHLPQVNMFNYTVQHAHAIMDNGFHALDSCANEAVINQDINLQDYQIVIWILGEESTTDRTFSTTEQSLVQTYLNNGGNLMVSGSEIGWDLDYNNYGRNFFRNHLHAEYVADSSDMFTVMGSGGPESIFYDLTPEETLDSFEDPFDAGGPKNEWSWFWTNTPYGVVSSHTDWRGVQILPRAGGDGYFLYSEYGGSDFGTHGIQAGSFSDSNYTLEGYVYMAYDEGGSVIPQFVGHYTGSNSYTRVQFQYRDDTHWAPHNNVRVQARNGGWTSVVFESYDDTTEPGIFDGEGWYHVKAQWHTGPQISVWVNDRYAGTADLTGTGANMGRFAIGGFSYGNSSLGDAPHNPPQYVYWDDFKALDIPSQIDFEDGSSKLMYWPRFPDVYSPAAGSIECLRYNDGITDRGVAAVQYSGEYRVIHLGFPFETIKEESMRSEMMGRILQFFGELPTSAALWTLFE